MNKLLLLFIAVGISPFISFSQAPTKFQPDTIIALQSVPASADMNWQGGERNQVSEWDKMATVSNVSTPTLTAYLPEPSKANGTALVIAPGGGFHFLSIDNEGNDVATWCVKNGIAAFVLKYRLVPTGENPSQEFAQKLQAGQEQMDKQMRPYIELANADGLAAIAHVRANATEYGIDPNRIGIIGFSAGGTVAAAAGLEYTSEENRPDFIAPIYAALHVLDVKKLPAEPMPLFMAVTGDDFFGFQTQSIDLYKTWNAAKMPAEMHIYEQGNHGFGMKKQGLPSDEWINAFGKWLESKGFISNKFGGMTLYTVRNEMATALVETLEKVAGIGYKYVEAVNYQDGKFYGMSPDAFNKQLMDLGLTPLSVHMGMITLDNADQLIADAKAAGFKYVIAPVPPMGLFQFNPESRSLSMTDDVDSLVNILNILGQKTKAAGLEFLYHNHDFEFKANKNGIVPIDYMLEKLNSEYVNFQMDLYWVVKAGVDPVAYFEKYPGRFKLWHVKDMDKEGRFAPVGTGTIDFKKILENKELSGMKYYIVEQDQTFDGVEPLEAIKISREGLKKIGFQ